MIIKSYLLNGGQSPYEPVDKELAEEQIGRYFNNAHEIVEQLESGELPIIRTPWAFYRKEVDEIAA